MVRARICLLALAVAGITGGALARVPGSFEVGKPFPALALPAAEDGRPMSIADFRGQRLVLHVFASW